MISIDDFHKVVMRIGKILSAERIEGSGKLLKLSIDFGEETPRQVLSGIAVHFPDPQALVGKCCPFATNLEPRKMMGLESQGMIMAVGTPEGFFSLLEASPDTPPGSLIK